MCFSKKNVYRLAKHGFVSTSRTPMEWKPTVSQVKKKFLVLQLVKKVILTVFWDMKGSITIDLLEKVNSASYCEGIHLFYWMTLIDR